MAFYIRETLDQTAMLLGEDGTLIAIFPDVDEAEEACGEDFDDGIDSPNLDDAA